MIVDIFIVQKNELSKKKQVAMVNNCYVAVISPFVISWLFRWLEG